MAKVALELDLMKLCLPDVRMKSCKRLHSHKQQVCVTIYVKCNDDAIDSVTSWLDYLLIFGQFQQWEFAH